MSRIRTIALSLAIIAVDLGPALAEVAETSTNDAVGIAAVKIPLAAAIAEAEKHVQGKAVHAEFEKVDGQAIYEVEVTTWSKVFDVKVDADKGTVIASKEDQRDGEAGEKAD